MGKIEISVIVPAYNAAKYIEKCIFSIINSSKNDIEIIVVEDGSTDDTLEKLKSIVDPRLKIIQSGIRGGVSKARNVGLKIAIGKYITFVDSDDWIAPEMLEKLYDTAEKYDADITICNHFEIYPGKKKNAGNVGESIIFQGSRIDQYIEMFMLKGNEQFKPYFPIGQPWGILFRTSLIKDNHLKFVEGMQYKEDVIFNLYAAQYSSIIIRINEPLYYYNKCNSTSLTSFGLKKGMLPRVEKDIEERNKFYKPELFTE